jgi:hypothetical protein
MITPILILFFVLVVEVVFGNGLNVNSGKISGADGDFFVLEEDVVRFDSIMNVGCGKQSSFVQVLCVATGRYIVVPIVNLKHCVSVLTVKFMLVGFVVFSIRVLCFGSSQFAGFSFIRRAYSFTTPAFVTYGITNHLFTGTLLASSCLPGAALTGIISSTSCPHEVAVSGNLVTYSNACEAAIRGNLLTHSYACVAIFPVNLLTYSYVREAVFPGADPAVSYFRDAALACFAPCSIPHFRSPIFTRT